MTIDRLENYENQLAYVSIFVEIIIIVWVLIWVKSYIYVTD